MISCLTFSAFLTSIISAVVGMAGGIVLLSIMTFFLPLNIIIPIHGLVQLVSNTTRTWLLRIHVIKPVFLYFLIGLPFGGLTSVYFIKQVDSKVVPLSLIAGLIIYTLFKPKKLPALKIPFWAFVFIGFFVGVLGPLIGATGPFMAPFFLRSDWEKENIVATKASVQIMGHLIKIPVFLYIGFPYLDYTLTIFLMAAVSLIGTKVGIMILGKIEDKIFRWIYKIALFAALIRLVDKILSLL
ncbi:MAG: sulfite exporter TauE/SafE family protein [Bacteriovoracaceae bacterium]|jgi:uncharacterized protein|nr:sulfite exporter TauE/SafE family protein [Bacteriovoracaceae bacterium]